MTLPARPIWMDLATYRGRDIIPFYEAVCGWQAAESSDDFGGYFRFFNNGVPVAGAMPTASEYPNGWTMYVQVDDITETMPRVTAAGGSVAAGPIPIADMGTMAVILDPAGAVFGLWAPGTFSGFPLEGRTGAPVWCELYSKNYAGAQAFYSSVFGWTFDVMSDTDQFRYSTVSVAGERVLGLMDFSAEMHSAMPSYWNIYVSVANCDEAAAAAVAHGGELIMAPTDTPKGRMAAVRDPDGSVFSLMQAK